MVSDTSGTESSNPASSSGESCELSTQAQRYVAEGYGVVVVSIGPS